MFFCGEELKTLRVFTVFCCGRMVLSYELGFFVCIVLIAVLLLRFFLCISCWKLAGFVFQ